MEPPSKRDQIQTVARFCRQSIENMSDWYVCVYVNRKVGVEPMLTVEPEDLYGGALDL
jgi:hypothetical protein